MCDFGSFTQDKRNQIDTGHRKNRMTRGVHRSERDRNGRDGTQFRWRDSVLARYTQGFVASSDKPLLRGIRYSLFVRYRDLGAVRIGNQPEDSLYDSGKSCYLAISFSQRLREVTWEIKF
jgi:hypothetical protein